MREIDLNKLNSLKNNPVEKEKKPVFDFLNKDIKLFGSQLSDRKKERFYSELGILLSAGVDIKTSFELIEEQQSKPADKELFGKIKNNVMGGKSLSDAFEEAAKFSAYEIFSIRIGEESGRLIEVLNEITIFYGKKIKQKRQLVNAISYPSVVLVVAMGAIFFMMNFIVPMFADVFKRFGGDLPYLTKLVIKASHFVSNYGLLFILFLCICIFFLYSQRNTEWFRKAGSEILIKIPFFGEMIKKIYLARFWQSMNLLLAAKTPIVNALGLVKNMVGFYPIEKSLNNVREDILKGKHFHDCLSKYKVYPSRMLSLVKVAEEVNQLDVIFEKLARQYSDEVEYETSMIGSFIEPIMILFLGLFVAVILIAIYLPLFQLSTSVH